MCPLANIKSKLVEHTGRHTEMLLHNLWSLAPQVAGFSEVGELTSSWHQNTNRYRATVVCLDAKRLWKSEQSFILVGLHLLCHAQLLAKGDAETCIRKQKPDSILVIQIQFWPQRIIWMSKSNFQGALGTNYTKKSWSLLAWGIMQKKLIYRIWFNRCRYGFILRNDSV